MIPCQPDFANIFKLPVLGDFSRGEVVVIVDYRKIFSIIVIENSRKIRMQ